MAASLKWGLLSTARINRRLIPAIRAAQRAELVAVASRSQERAESYATEWGIPRAHGGYQALLDDPGIDAVYISLPNSLHAEWSVRAAQAGKHVLCEKPLALNVEQCDQLMAAAQSSGVVAMEAVMYLHHPLLHKAREMVREGALGQVRLVRGAFSFYLDRPDDVRWEPDLGGGSLWDVGSYPVSFMRWMLGEPEQVFGWQTLSQSGIDEAFGGLLRYGNGVLGIFDCGFRHPFRVQAEVIGESGTLIIERPYPISSESRIVLRRDQEQEIISAPQADAYRCQVEALTAAALDGAALPIPLSSSRANVATLAALYQSARENIPIKVAAP
jgi:xylose dehydrogenase (NAD/NADP)